MNAQVQSKHFPFVNLRLDIHGRSFNIEALIDTGFDGFVAGPAGRDSVG